MVKEIIVASFLNRFAREVYQVKNWVFSIFFADSVIGEDQNFEGRKRKWWQ